MDDRPFDRVRKEGRCGWERVTCGSFVDSLVDRVRASIVHRAQRVVGRWSSSWTGTSCTSGSGSGLARQRLQPQQQGVPDTDERVSRRTATNNDERDRQVTTTAYELSRPWCACWCCCWWVCWCSRPSAG